jgi:kinesin family protein C2/C3
MTVTQPVAEVVMSSEQEVQTDVIDTSDKDAEIQSLQQALQAKEQQITQLNEDIASKEKQIIELREALIRAEMEATAKLLQKDHDIDTVRSLTERTIREEMERQMKDLVEKYQAEHSMRKEYYNKLQELKGNIRVFCRVRPMSEQEQAHQSTLLATANSGYDVSMVTDFPAENAIRLSKKRFDFDRVFEPSVDQSK